MRVASSASVAQSDICVDSGKNRLSRVESDAWYLIYAQHLKS